MNTQKLNEAIERLELFYWDCNRNGGPDVEVLGILRLCEEARDTEEPSEDEVYELAVWPDEEEYLDLTDEPPRPPAA